MRATSEFQIGIACIAGAIFLLLVGIPNAVNEPSNIPHIVLAPRFWPQIICGLLIALGVGLVLASARAEPGEADRILDIEGGPRRLALMAAAMAAYFVLIPLLGMVWASMLAFAAVAWLVHTRHPVAAVVAAVLVPLALYAFFAHVAAVAIPQGEFVRLP